MKYRCQRYSVKRWTSASLGRWTFLFIRPTSYVLRPTYVLSVLCLLTSVFCLLSSVCFSQVTNSTELINNAKQYDGKLIVYQGEAIGDIMLRGEHAWVNVHDGKNAIGVWVKKDLAGNITFTGSYKFKGDIIEVEGTFNRSCAMHGGDLDIHAEGIAVIQRGRAVDEVVSLSKQKWAIGLGIILLLTVFLTLFKRNAQMITDRRHR